MSDIVHKKYKKPPLLVPTDFSRHALAALKCAHELAVATHRHIILLHVVHDPEHAPGYYNERSANGVLTMDDVAAEMCKEFISQAASEVENFENDRIDVLLVPGSPTRRILEVANMVQPYMIVMGSHGRRQGVRGFLIGSKSLKVVKRSVHPVTIVKAPEVQEHLEVELRKKGKL